jgi:hypothetical protein
MPQIPVYGGPQVAADPLRPVQARALDVSSGTRAIGQGLANLGEGIDRYAEREAQAQAFNAEDTLTKEWLAWDSQARKHYVGEKATEYEAAAAEWWAKAPETVGTTLNPRARELVGRSLAQKRNSAMASVMTAAGAEKERHADQVALADIDSTLQFGVTTGNVDAARMQIQEKVAALGARKGWSTELVQKAQGEYLSQMHMAQIDSLPAEAGLAYFREHRDEIDFDKQGRTEKYLERSIEVEQKQREADAEKATRDAEDAAMNQALSLYANNDKVPPSLMSTLAPRDRIQLQNMIETRAAGREVKTDIATYLELNDAIGRGEAVDLRKYSNAISTSDLKGLAEKQGKSQQDGFLTDEQRQNKALLDLGIDKKKQGEEAYAVLGLIDQRTREASTAKGNKSLTPDEKQAVIDGVVLDRVYVNEWGTDPQKLAPLLTPEETSGAYVKVGDKEVLISAVPADKRMAIISARRARGLPVTEQAIVETYLRKYPNGQ